MNLREIVQIMNIWSCLSKNRNYKN